MTSADIPVCVVTAQHPDVITKRYSLANGELRKKAGGIVTRGFAEIVDVVGLEGLAKLLMSLRPDQALTFGLPPQDQIGLITSDLWHRDGRPTDRIPRTAQTFHWNEGPGILMLDYDPEPGQPVMSREELVAALRGVVPSLSAAQLLWWPSASSHIINTKTGEDLTGLRGQRLYLPVADARDIPRAGAAIVDRLWLAGRGYYKVSKSGSLLARTLFDASVWQTNRLDFAAGAACSRPLRQDRGDPVVVSPEE